MILVDTSVWIDFLRKAPRTSSLSELLLGNEVACHPWIVGEIALGSLGKVRSQFLADLDSLPQLPIYPSADIRDFIESESLFGKGLSWVDCQLLYAAIIQPADIWTHDKALHTYATSHDRAWNLH